MSAIKRIVISTMFNTLCLLIFSHVTSAMQIKQTFRDPGGSQLQHMVVHRDSGNIFLGATNNLIKLSSELQLEERIVTGPELDNPSCPPPSLPCMHNKTETDSFSKGLVIDYKDGVLILCSTLFHGSCQRRSLGSLSTVDKTGLKPIVPNSPTIPAFMFISPGVNSERVLHVASTYSGLGNKAYRDMVPSVSSRRLDNLELSYRDGVGATKVTVRNSVRDDFLVKYIYGFSYRNFIYFITTQRESAQSTKYGTKIVRICQNDKYYRSYVEIPLHCLASAVERYNMAQGAYLDVSSGKLYVTFAKTGENMDVLTGSSALCSYTMGSLILMFNKTVEECYQGNGYIGPAHLHKEESCKQTSAKPDMCAESDIAEAFPSIEGRNPVYQSPLVQFPQTVLTAVTVVDQGSHTLVFLGTMNGGLKKVVTSPDGQVSVVDEMEVDHGKPINKELLFDADKNHLYALTPYKVTKISVKHCEEKKTCSECTKTPDPLCGWCIMENRCCPEKECQSSMVSPRWLPSRHGACARMANVQPDVLSFESMEGNQVGQEISFKLEEVALSKIDNLDLHCSFVTEKTWSRTVASLQNEVITCPLPGRHQLPTIPEGKDYHNVEVQFHVGGQSIVKRSVPVYDCRVHDSCTECTESQFSCQWCYASNTCVHAPAGTCTGQTGAGIQHKGDCPKVDLMTDDTDIVVHSGETKDISVRVQNLQAGQTDNVKCHFMYLKESKVVPGTITSSNLYCDTVEFAFVDTETPYVTAAFKVTWGPNEIPLDNPRGIKVRIFKCPLMVTNCGKCLSMDPEYECGWCDSQCTLQKHCTGTWLDRSATCPNPQILRFSPTSGPIQGKTNVSVTGINLGKAYTDISGGVTVAGVTCVLHPTHYEPSSRFTCETEPTASKKTGLITVVVNGKFTANSDSHFSFVSPEVFNIAPKKGPRSGGTVVVITGEYLNTGSSRSVDVGGSPCTVQRYNMTTLECMTSHQTTSEDSVDVEVDFGGHKRLLNEKFTYELDPIITRIEPKKTIISGGTRVTVIGTNLNLIQRPEFFIIQGDKEIKSKCTQSGPIMTWLLCRTPELPVTQQNITDTNPREVHFGFNLDGVKTWRNISKQPDHGPMLYYPDPTIEPFAGEKRLKKYLKNDDLVIYGRFRNVNPLIPDVMVMVGADKCKNVASTDTAVTCSPPSKPGGIDDKGNALVQIQIGNLQRKVGYLNYYEIEESDKPIAMGIILGVVLPIIAIIILLTICVIRRHRKHKPSENYIPDVLKDYEGKKEEEEIGMNHVSVKADMNGSIPDDRDSGPYISELLAGIEDESVRQNISLLLIPRSKLEVGELLGKGNFGATYKAQYTRVDDEKPMQVAAKTLQGTNPDSEAVNLFLQRCVVMKDIQHPHILPIVGVSLTACDDPIIVQPYSEHGNLKSYIRDPSKNLTVLDLLELAHQVADGMSYLEEVRIIHRNLAARNCVLAEDRSVKVTDLENMQEMIHQNGTFFPQEYYFSDDNRSRTLTKWIAPETWQNFEFSSKTDVWSYGVLLWELLTRGVTPYPDVDANDLRTYIESGRRMKKPKQCPEYIYQLMMKCWAHDPNERPTFREIAEEIQRFIQSDTESGEGGETQPLKTNIEIGGSAEYLEVIA